MGLQQIPSKGGIPSGNTASRPGSPVVGDTYYNGQLELLEIYNGTQWVAASAPPAIPTITSITDVGTGLAYATGGTFTIEVAPGSGGATALQYNAVTTTGGFSASSSSTTISLTGLTSNTSFIVAANAQNNFGATANGPSFSAVTATTVPQAPTIGTATASESASEATVSWTLNNTGGKALTAITITPYLNGTTAETSRTAATTSSTSYTFIPGQLTSGASYTFKVKTTNANGDSLESSATNSVTISNNISIDYLVVAGGGGGGFSASNGGGAGGGAGGLRSTVTASGGSPGTVESILVLTKSTNYTVTVGAGGSGGINSTTTQPTNGVNSVFSTVTSTGGGKGGTGSADAASGGSGGGGHGDGRVTAGAGTANQGFAGGTGTSGGPDDQKPGGGGGAGQIGGNASTDGDGGNGVAVSITGTSVTYAGGGGGGETNRYGTPTGPGTGGTGGGGAGHVAGTANTGGGGGGGQRTSGNGANGGSGVVVLRWLTVAGSITVGAGLTADSTGTDGSYSYKRFTAGSGNVSFA
jgi:hypothetical protein